ncbi:AAA family ATPase [Streptomyces sp. NPDC001292]|uniref:AAA family ATPase n=1 Tax=Streptomyces sp. NPDC001292 TaxID=3364558 RepID=UPI0036BD2BA1
MWERFTKEIETGNDVVLDHGLRRRGERDAWRQTAREAGGLLVVVCLLTNREELLRRLVERNEREDVNALTVTPRSPRRLPRPLRPSSRRRGSDRLRATLGAGAGVRGSGDTRA